MKNVQRVKKLNFQLTEDINQIKQTNTDLNKNFESKLDEINLKLNVLNETQRLCKLEQSEINDKVKT